MYNVVYCTCTM